MILTLLLSLVLSADLLPPAKWLPGTAENAMVFKLQITQGEPPRLPPITAVLFPAVPVMDMGLVTVRRPPPAP